MSLLVIFFLVIACLSLLLLQGQQHVVEIDLAVMVQIGGSRRRTVGWLCILGQLLRFGDVGRVWFDVHEKVRRQRCIWRK